MTELEADVAVAKILGFSGHFPLELAVEACEGQAKLRLIVVQPTKSKSTRRRVLTRRVWRLEKQRLERSACQWSYNIAEHRKDIVNIIFYKKSLTLSLQPTTTWTVEGS